MQSRHINVNITKIPLPAHQIHDVCGNVACCCVSYSPLICRVNAALTTVTPPLTLHPLTNSFHNMVWTVTIVLSASRLRAFRLARSVSSRAVFVVASSFALCLLYLSTIPSLFSLFVQYGTVLMKPARYFSLSDCLFIGMGKWRGIKGNKWYGQLRLDIGRRFFLMICKLSINGYTRKFCLILN